MLKKNLINIGLGTASFAGINMVGSDSYSRPSDREIDDLLNYIYEFMEKFPKKKIMIDTSIQYGESEKRLGRFFHNNIDKRKKFFISSKWGLKFNKNNFSISDYSIENLNLSLENSLKLLQKIDIYYIHTNPSINLNDLDFLVNKSNKIQERFISLKNENIGGIKYLGISISSLENLKFIIKNIEKMKYLDSIQINSHLLTQNPNLARELDYTDKLIVLNSLYRKSFPENRKTQNDRKKIFYDSFFSVRNSIILTGTRKIKNFNEVIEFENLFKNYRNIQIKAESEYFKNKKLIQNLNNDLNNFFQLHETENLVVNKKNHNVIEEIVNIFIGSNKTRIGAKPDTNQTKLLSDIVKYYVEKKIPIETILTWGPKKFYPFPERFIVDLSELISLKTLNEIRKKIILIYPIGANFNIFIEDFEGKFIEGEHLEKEFDEYISSFEKLKNIVGLYKYIKIIRTSDLLKMKFNLDDVNKQIFENYKKLIKFWYESENMTDKETLQLITYKDLNKIGWNGPIDEETRNYYINRLNKILGDSKSLKEKVDMTVRLLACVLLHRQYDVFKVNNFSEPVKLSFLKISGGPKKLMNGRIDIRTIPTNVSKRHISPWASRACIRKKKNQFLPYLSTWGEVEENKENFKSCEINLSNNFQSLKIDTFILEYNNSD